MRISAIFFALDKVHGYKRVFSLQDTSCVFTFLLQGSLATDTSHVDLDIRELFMPFVAFSFSRRPSYAVHERVPARGTIWTCQYGTVEWGARIGEWIYEGADRKFRMAMKPSQICTA